jgi:hypothetical protein
MRRHGRGGEIRDLKCRVGELEGGFGFPTQQVRAVHLVLLNFQTLTNSRFDKVEDRLDRVEGRLGRVETEVASLREELPTVVADVMREALREEKS